MDWGLVLLGGCFGALWLLLGAIFRWVEVRDHLRLWGPGPYGPDSHPTREETRLARMSKQGQRPGGTVS